MKIGWGKPTEKGHFLGLSQMMGFGSYVAGAAEVSVEGDKIKIHRIVGATDPGYAVNPAQIDRQVAGSFVYGLSALFYGEITVKDGAVEQANFDTYNSMRIAEMPKVESIMLIKLCFFAKAAIFAKSTTRNAGFVGDSK